MIQDQLFTEERHKSDCKCKQCEAARQTWRTPPGLFMGLNSEFGFRIDAAADESNHLLPSWLGPKDDAPECQWQIEGIPVPTWWNPPFDSCLRWCKAARREQGTGTLSVGLTLGGINTQWFTRHALPFCEWWTFDARVRYIPPPGIKKSSPDRDSMLLVFDPENPVGRLGGVRCHRTGRVLWRSPQLSGSQGAAMPSVAL